MHVRELGRIATLAIVPAMVLAIVWTRDVARPQPRPEPVHLEGTLLVGALRAHSLVAVDPATGRQRTLSLPGPPHELLVNGDRLYATLGRADLLAEVNLPALAMLRVAELAGEPHGLAWWDGLLAVALDRVGEVVAVDPATLGERGRWTVGRTPHALAAFEGELYVAEAADGAVRRVGTGRPVPVGGGPESLSIVEGVVVAALVEENAVALLPLEPSGEARTLSVGPRPARVTDAGNGRFAVALSGSGQVALHRLADGALLWRVTVGRLPDGVCPSPDGRYLAVAATGDDRVVVLDLETASTVATYSVTGGPGACVWLDR